MKLVLAVALLAACGGSSKPTDTTTTAPSDPVAPPPASSPAPPPMQQMSPHPRPVPTVKPDTIPPATVQPATTKKPTNSCFTYNQRGSTVKRFACMRTEECGPYLDQARQVGGIVADGGCFSVETLFCFHQAPTKTDPQGLDVCQPTLDACKSERALLVKKGTSVDTDCAQR